MKSITLSPRYIFILLAIGAIIAILISISVNRIKAGNNTQEVGVSESRSLDGLTVTLDSVTVGSSETQLTYSLKVTVGEGTEPVSLPTLLLSDGTQLKSRSIIEGGAYDVSKESWTRIVSLPAIPGDADTIVVKLGSQILYTSAVETVSLQLGTALGQLGGRSDLENPLAIPLDVPFAIGGATFQLASITLKPHTFALEIKPVNEDATQIVFAGGLSRVKATDNSGQVYKSYLTEAKWNQSKDGVQSQFLFFEGQPSSSVTGLSLEFDGLGEIKSGFDFNVNLE
jgi:hypothetical protein